MAYICIYHIWAKKKDEIRNLDTNKTHEKSYLLAENLSVANSITSHGSTSIAELGLVTKKRKPPRISLHISHPD